MPPHVEIAITVGRTRSLLELPRGSAASPRSLANPAALVGELKSP